MATEDVLRGAGHVGPSRWFGLNGSWPFASLAIEPGAVTFRLWPFIDYRFERGAIVALWRRRGVFGSELVIVHRDPRCAKSVIFRPMSFARLEERLAAAGHSVAAEAPAHDEPVEYSRTVGTAAAVAAALGVAVAIAAVVLGGAAR